MTLKRARESLTFRSKPSKTLLAEGGRNLACKGFQPATMIKEMSIANCDVIQLHNHKYNYIVTFKPQACPLTPVKLVHCKLITQVEKNMRLLTARASWGRA
jgi:hypothetical protein